MRRTVYKSRNSTGMLAGALNNKVSLQRRATGQDPDTGAPVDGWTEYASVWGQVLMLTGKEAVTNGTTVGMGAASIRIRFRQDVTNGDRAISQGVVFNIGEPIPNVFSREYTDLPCTFGENNGG